MPQTTNLLPSPKPKIGWRWLGPIWFLFNPAIAVYIFYHLFGPGDHRFFLYFIRFVHPATLELIIGFLLILLPTLLCFSGLKRSMYLWEKIIFILAFLFALFQLSYLWGFHF